MKAEIFGEDVGHLKEIDKTVSTSSEPPLQEAIGSFFSNM